MAQNPTEGTPIENTTIASKVSDSPLAPAEKAELLTWLPGWRGYKIRDMIRQDDVLVRNFVRDYLMKVEEQVLDYDNKLVNADPFDKGVSDIENLKAKLRSVIDEVFSAPEGMLSFYVRFKFTNEEQQKLVDFDLHLLALVKSLLESSKVMNVQKLTDQVQDLHDQFFVL